MSSAEAAHRASIRPTAIHALTEVSTEQHAETDGPDADELGTLGVAPASVRSEVIGEGSPAPTTTPRIGQEPGSVHVLPFSDLSATNGLSALIHLTDATDANPKIHDRAQGGLGREELTSRLVATTAEVLERGITANGASTLDRSTSPPSIPSLRAEDTVEIPPPRGIGMIAEALPFGRDSLEGAVDRFLEGFEEMGAPPLGRGGIPPKLLPPLMLATSVVALEIARRRVSHERTGRTITGLATDRGGLAARRLPGMPGTH